MQDIIQIRLLLLAYTYARYVRPNYTAYSAFKLAHCYDLTHRESGQAPELMEDQSGVTKNTQPTRDQTSHVTLTMPSVSSYSRS